MTAEMAAIRRLAVVVASLAPLVLKELQDKTVPAAELAAAATTAVMVVTEESTAARRRRPERSPAVVVAVATKTGLARPAVRE